MAERDLKTKLKNADVIITDKFKTGDIICSKKNIDQGFYWFFEASSDDVEWCKTGNFYAKIIKDKKNVRNVKGKGHRSPKGKKRS